MITVIILILTSIQFTQCYEGVMLVPGFNFNMTKFEILRDAIQQEHPGTDVVIATFAFGKLTEIPLWTQIHEIYKSKDVTDFLNRNSDGFHLFAHSQGSLLSRGMIEYYGLRIINYVTGAGVHMGYYGNLGDWDQTIEQLRLRGIVGIVVENAYTTFYTDWSQGMIFLAGYWRDPCHVQEYSKHSKFLAELNNEANHTNAEKFKNNFCNITNLHMFDGPDDEVIDPWRSGHFEFISCNGSVIPMKELRVYTEDLIGLRTLDERNAVFHQEFPDTKHGDFNSLAFFQEHVMHLLT